MKLQALRGMRDLLPQTLRRFRFIESKSTELASRYGFEEIETPLLESASLFLRSLGESSDVVSKQMYLFKDLGGDDLVLRPEGTAGVARAFISEGLAQSLPLRLFYKGAMFRYERPQKGRYRQFYQFGVELLGSESVQADLEVISLGQRILRELEVASKCQLLVNTIGDDASRDQFRTVLVSYLSKYESELSEDSQRRLKTNPLRILDSKDPRDKKILVEAPKLRDCLSSEAQNFFELLLKGLSQLGIDFQIDPNLVRGLDYYCHTVFEFVTNELGSQNAVLSGGRYDQLISDLGGPKTPGVGWGSGIDRLSELLPKDPERRDVHALVPIGEAAETLALSLAEKLRDQNLQIELGLSGNMAKRMKRADKIGARTALIFGENELSKNSIQVKNLKTGQQFECPISELNQRLSQLVDHS